MDLNKSCKQSKQRSDTTNHRHASNGSSHCKLTIWQASSQNTQHWREIHFRNKIWWTSTKGIHSRQLGRNPTINESDENTRTLIHQHKSWQHPKIVPLTVAPMLLQHKRLTVSNMLLQKRDPHQNKKSNGSQPLNASVKAWQQHHNGSIWCTSNKQNTAQHQDPLRNQLGWNSTETAASTHQSPEGRTFSTAKFKHFW